MKNEFEHITNQTIKSIKRIDIEKDYDFDYPYSVCFGLNDSVLKITTNDDSSSIDIRITSWEEIEHDDGLEFDEYFLHDLKQEDLLSKLLNETITNLEIAQYKEEITKGENWVSYNGKYAGIRITTVNHTFVYYNRHEGYCCIDLINEIPDNTRWEMIKQ